MMLGNQTVEQIEKIKKYCIENAKLFRSNLPVNITEGNGYKNGFDNGYNLGCDHALEEIERVLITKKE